MIIFFKFFPMVPPMKFFFTLWYPKGSKKNWPKCHSGQSVSGQSVTLAKVSLWPKCHFGQNVTLAKVSLAKLSLQPNCLWPKCLWPKGHSGQTVNLAKVSWPKCLWPKCHSGRSVIQPNIQAYRASIMETLISHTCAIINPRFVYLLPHF